MKPQAPERSKIRVLIIDDDEDDVLILRKYLKSTQEYSFEIESTYSFDDAKRMIATNNHDVYLVDYRLGEKTGLDLLREVEPNKHTQPFILITGASDKSLINKSVREAASDLLTKGSFDSEMLVRVVLYAIERKHFEEERIEHMRELSRSKDEFISIASHQLRTPATSVKQYAGMLREGFFGEFSEKQRQIIEKIYDNNERQLRIVSDLLKVAQVDAGKIQLRIEPVDVAELVRAIVDGFEDTVKKRNQTIIVTGLESFYADVDENALQMVFENLIDNASKYSFNDSKITIDIARENDDHYVTIIDEGVGVDENMQDRLFQKFTRIDNELSTKVGGTGLGLYWAKQVVCLHDGASLEYQPNRPQGSKFIVKFTNTARGVK